jgi:Na+-transporting NADH:ubiquinone oxidoreductase subunit NqrE
MFKKTITYSLALGIIITGIFILQYINNVHTNPPKIYGVVSLLTIVIFIFLGIKNNITEGFQIKDGLKTGIAIAVISGIIFWIYQVIHVSFIEPELIYKIQELKFKQYVEFFPETSDEKLKVLKDEFLDGYHFNNFVGIMLPSLFTGFITAMVSSAILKYRIQKNS